MGALHEQMRSLMADRVFDLLWGIRVFVFMRDPSKTKLCAITEMNREDNQSITIAMKSSCPFTIAVLLHACIVQFFTSLNYTVDTARNQVDSIWRYFGNMYKV